MRILMLGWEFPPEISGGLGSATEGLVHGLIEAGAEVLLLLPGRAQAQSMGAGQLALAPASGGLDSGAPVQGSRSRRASLPGIENEALRLLRVPSPLQPYQTAASYASVTSNYGTDLRTEVERFAQRATANTAQEDFDLIYAHDWMSVPAALSLAQQSGKPWVWHVHSTEYDRQASADGAARVDPQILAIEQCALQRSQRVICVSQYSADLLASHYHFDSDKLSIVHNGLGQRLLQPKTRQKRARQVSTSPLILFLGRLAEQKGPRFFLQAAAHVARELPRARFVIAGEGDQHPELLRLVAKLGLEQSVHFTGFLRGTDVERMYALADVYVMPSRSEPFGIAALEAMHAEVPVVLSKHSGVAEVIPSALCVEPSDSQAMAQAILDLCRDPRLRARQTRAARRELEPLRWEASAAKLIGLFEELCP